MAIITWDEIGERYYETGIKNCVLYPVNNGVYSTGVAWKWYYCFDRKSVWCGS